MPEFHARGTRVHSYAKIIAKKDYRTKNIWEEEQEKVGDATKTVLWADV